MSNQIADPYQGLISFQQALLEGIVDIHPVKPHQDLYSHFDVPAPGVNRLTYVRLAADRKTVTAFLACVMNGEVDGDPCVSFGYAVPESMQGQGNAKEIMRDVIKDQVKQAKRALCFETVVGVDNVASQRVSEAVFEVRREEIVDGASQLPAYRYTKRVDLFTVLETAKA